MRRWIGIAAVFGAALLGAGSCAEGLQPTKGGSSGDSTSSSSSSSSGSMGSACTGYAKSACAKLQSCATTLFNANYADLAACETRLGLSCNQRAKAPGTSFNATKIEACAAEYDALACADFYSPDLCKPTAGSLADGAVCGDHFQCKSTFCDSPNGMCGTCAPRLALGDSCVSNPDQCELGLVCDSTCQTPVALNGGCSSSAQCEAGLRCTTMNMCAKQPSKLGDPCDYINVGCDLAAGLWCDSGSSTCIAIDLAQPGQSCSVAAGSYTMCAAGALCYNQSCVATVADGTTCDGTGNPPCESQAECINGKCQVFDPASCSGGSPDLCLESCLDSQGSATGMSVNGSINWTQSSCACGGLKSGSPAGASCTQASDCAEVCCFCCTGARSFQVQACVGGQCQGAAQACPLAKSTSADGTFDRIQCD